MVQGGHLPALRVGKQWRFDRADIERWLRSRSAPPAPNSGAAAAAVTPATGATPHLSELLPAVFTQMMQDAFADALGVMMIVTDMDGVPVTRVSNACGLYNLLMSAGEPITRCIQNWQAMAGALTLEPKFAPNDLGLLCARGLIRSGNELKGMVFVGGIAPEAWPPAAREVDAIAAHFGLPTATLTGRIEQVYHAGQADRERVLSFVQRIADLLSHLIEDRSDLNQRLHAIASLTGL
jgi:hypothetical protein